MCLVRACTQPSERKAIISDMVYHGGIGMCDLTWSADITSWCWYHCLITRSRPLALLPPNGPGWLLPSVSCWGCLCAVTHRPDHSPAVSLKLCNVWLKRYLRHKPLRWWWWSAEFSGSADGVHNNTWRFCTFITPWAPQRSLSSTSERNEWKFRTSSACHDETTGPSWAWGVCVITHYQDSNSKRIFTLCMKLNGLYGAACGQLLTCVTNDT